MSEPGGCRFTRCAITRSYTIPRLHHYIRRTATPHHTTKRCVDPLREVMVNRWRSDRTDSLFSPRSPPRPPSLLTLCRRPEGAFPMDRSLGIWEWHYDKERGRGVVRVYQRVSKQCVRYLCVGCGGGGCASASASVCLRVPNKCAVYARTYMWTLSILLTLLNIFSGFPISTSLPPSLPPPRTDL